MSDMEKMFIEMAERDAPRHAFVRGMADGRCAFQTGAREPACGEFAAAEVHGKKEDS